MGYVTPENFKGAICKIKAENVIRLTQLSKEWEEIAVLTLCLLVCRDT